LKQECGKLVAILTAIRPLGWAPTLFALIFGIIDARADSVFGSLLLMLCYGPLLAGYGYVVNFMSDSNIDRQSSVKKDIVMTKQPFATGALSKREGFFIACLLAGSGLLLSWHVSVSVFVTGCGLLILGTAYSYPPRLKGVPLLDVVANGAIVALCYVAGWVAFEPISSISLFPILWIFFLVAATYMLTVLIDIECDRECGIRSIAVVFGTSNTAKLAFACYLISMVFYVICAATLQRISYYLVGIGLFWAMKSFFQLAKDPHPERIYAVAKKATLAAAISVPVLGLIYWLLILLGMQR
jgi:4-hydroxybenzoate polyprenyltransferase